MDAKSLAQDSVPSNEAGRDKGNWRPPRSRYGRILPPALPVLLEGIEVSLDLALGVLGSLEALGHLFLRRRLTLREARDGRELLARPLQIAALVEIRILLLLNKNIFAGARQAIGSALRLESENTR